MRGTWQTTDSGGRGGLVLIVIVAALALGSGAASAAVSALEELLIIIGSVIGLAVLGGLGLLVYRARQGGAGRPIAAPAVYQVPPAAPQRLEGPEQSAIGTGRELHIHLHGLTPDQIAAIITQRGAYLEDR